MLPDTGGRLNQIKGWRKVNNRKNSECCSARLSDLDFSNWWMDNSWGMMYLHVQHKTEDTVHRVHCRTMDNPRIAMHNGVLKWLVNK